MAAISKVSISLDAAAALQSAVKKLLKQEVLVGIPDSTAERKPEESERQPANNALIGYVQEFGDDEKNIPPRPFLVPGVQDARDQIVKQLQGAGKGTLDGDANAVDVGFQKAGLAAQNAVRSKITDGPFTPLSPRTLQKRRAKGRTGEKPLIDTGQLRNSVTYVVRDKSV